MKFVGENEVVWYLVSKGRQQGIRCGHSREFLILFRFAEIFGSTENTPSNSGLDQCQFDQQQSRRDFNGAKVQQKVEMIVGQKFGADAR